MKIIKLLLTLSVFSILLRQSWKYQGYNLETKIGYIIYENCNNQTYATKLKGETLHKFTQSFQDDCNRNILKLIPLDEFNKMNASEINSTASQYLTQ